MARGGCPQPEERSRNASPRCRALARAVHGSEGRHGWRREPPAHGQRQHASDPSRPNGALVYILIVSNSVSTQLPAQTELTMVPRKLKCILASTNGTLSPPSCGTLSPRSTAQRCRSATPRRPLRASWRPGHTPSVRCSLWRNTITTGGEKWHAHGRVASD